MCLPHIVIVCLQHSVTECKRHGDAICQLHYVTPWLAAGDSSAPALRDRVASSVVQALVREISGTSDGRKSPSASSLVGPAVPYTHPSLEMLAAVLTDMQSLLPRLNDARGRSDIRAGLLDRESEQQGLKLQVQDLERQRQDAEAEVQRLHATLELKDQRLATLEADLRGLETSVQGLKSGNADLNALVQRLTYNGRAMQAALRERQEVLPRPLPQTLPGASTTNPGHEHGRGGGGRHLRGENLPHDSYANAV